MKKLIIFVLVISTILGMLTSCNTDTAIDNNESVFVPVEFPKIPTKNLSHSIIVSFGGRKTENIIDQDKTEKIATFINNSEFVNEDVAKWYDQDLDGAVIEITFIYDDSSTVTFTESGHCVTSLCDGYFALKSAALDEYLINDLGIDVFGTKNLN